MGKCPDEASSRMSGKSQCVHKCYSWSLLSVSNTKYFIVSILLSTSETMIDAFIITVPGLMMNIWLNALQTCVAWILFSSSKSCCHNLSRYTTHICAQNHSVNRPIQCTALSKTKKTQYQCSWCKLDLQHSSKVISYYILSWNIVLSKWSQLYHNTIIHKSLNVHLHVFI